MANVLYPSFKEALLSGTVDLRINSPVTMEVKVILVDTADYTYSAAHTVLADVPAGARVAVSGALTGNTVSGGVFDANDVTLASVTGDVAEALVLYLDDGATDPLIAYLDTGYSNLPITPDGGDIVIVWPSDANKIFAL